MLRAPVRQRVFGILESSYFGAENFSVEFPLDGEFVLSITFVPNPYFSFRMKAPDKDNDVFTWECPSVEFVKVRPALSKGIDKALLRLEPWLELVKEETVLLHPFGRELAALKADVDRRLAGMQGSLDEYFSAGEVSDLEERLSTFQTRIDQLAEKNAELEGAVGTLRKAVEDLKAAAPAVSRGTWLRMSAGRLLGGLRAIATSKEGREFALEAAKKLLLDGPK